LNGIWSPKEGEKCDVKPKALGENSYFVVGVVTDVRNNGGKTAVKVKFFIDGSPKTEMFELPNADVT